VNAASVTRDIAEQHFATGWRRSNIFLVVAELAPRIDKQKLVVTNADIECYPGGYLFFHNQTTIK
jgi:hypothetical protein